MIMDGTTGALEATDLAGEALGGGTVGIDGIVGTTLDGEVMDTDGEVLGDGTTGAGEATDSDGVVLATVTPGVHHMATTATMPTEAMPTIIVEEALIIEIQSLAMLVEQH